MLFYLKVVKVIVTDIDTDAEVEASVPNIWISIEHIPILEYNFIPAINYFEVPEFNKICVFCIPYSHHWKKNKN